MTGPKFDTTVSLGNLLSVATVVVGLSIGWANLKAVQAEQLRRLEAVEFSSTQREARLRAVEIAQAGQNADLRAIQQGIAEIKVALERLSGEGRLP